MSNLCIEVLHAKSQKKIGDFEINKASTILDVKKAIATKKSHLYPDRQMLKADPAGKPLKDEDQLSKIAGDESNFKLYFKDLGPQVGWTTNSIYYWGFAAFVAYYTNHPLYTVPKFGDLQVYIGLAGFIFNELGNFSIHIALRDLRPAGSKERRIPFPTSNPFTYLFNFVSCPNYTYEIYSWISFTIMSQTLGAALFTIAGALQMTQWALGKHRNYRKEFEKYPRGRKSIFPFLI